MPYSFSSTWNNKIITIYNGKQSRQFSPEALRMMARSTGLPEAVRDMAEQALRSIGEEIEAPELDPGTIAQIQGVNIYQEPGKRIFFFYRGKKRIYKSSIAEIEAELSSDETI